MEAQQLPQNRNELIARLEDLRAQGVLGSAEEAELLRHFDALVRDSELEKARLEPEYERRLQQDGEQAARDWLADEARSLGERQGRATRELTDRLAVVTGDRTV